MRPLLRFFEPGKFRFFPCVSVFQSETMGPSVKELEAALIEGTYQVFSTDPDATTVNAVRRHVENSQGLEDEFFLSEEWKQRSKNVIKEYVVSIDPHPCMAAVHRVSPAAGEIIRRLGSRNGC